MKIKSVDVIGQRIPFSRSFPVSYEAHTHTEHAFIRIETNEGIQGFGEGTALPWFTGETTAGMVETLRERIIPRLLDLPVWEASARFDEFANSFTGSPGATSAVGMALLDLKAKQAELPLGKFIGPTFRTEVDEVYPIPGLDPQEAGKIAESAEREGYKHFKVKATGNLEIDVERINSVINSTSSNSSVRVDPNTSWETAPKAIEAISEIEGKDRIEYLEQPLDPLREETMTRIWEETGVPVFADESVHTTGDVERLGRQGTVAGVCLKLAKLGSPTRLYQAGRRAADYGLKVTVVSAFGTSLEAAANIHLISALPTLSSGCEVAPMFLEEDASTDPIRPAPKMKVPEKSGLGVTLDSKFFR